MTTAAKDWIRAVEKTFPAEFGPVSKHRQFQNGKIGKSALVLWLKEICAMIPTTE